MDISWHKNLDASKVFSSPNTFNSSVYTTQHCSWQCSHASSLSTRQVVQPPPFPSSSSTTSFALCAERHARCTWHQLNRNKLVPLKMPLLPLINWEIKSRSFLRPSLAAYLRNQRVPLKSKGRRGIVSKILGNMVISSDRILLLFWLVTCHGDQRGIWLAGITSREPRWNPSFLAVTNQLNKVCSQWSKSLLLMCSIKIRQYIKMFQIETLTKMLQCLNSRWSLNIHEPND